MEKDDRTLIELDTRGRASLGKIADRRFYLVRVEPGGVIVLEPAVVLPAADVNRALGVGDGPAHSEA